MAALRRLRLVAPWLLAAAVIMLLAAPARAKPGRLEQGGACSKQTATALQHGIPVLSVLCGAFAGAGSKAMVAITGSGVCMPFSGWEVYVLRGGSWEQLKLAPHGGLTGHPVVAVGSQLRETLDIKRAGDNLCNPTGGTRSRLWHWNGSALVPGPWQSASKPGAKPAAPASGPMQFRSPDGNIACEFHAGGSDNVGCVSVHPARYVTLFPDGRRYLCQHYDPCLFSTRIFSAGGPITSAPKLTSGDKASRYGITCTANMNAITCLLPPSRGFVISRTLNPIG